MSTSPEQQFGRLLAACKVLRPILSKQVQEFPTAKFTEAANAVERILREFDGEGLAPAVVTELRDLKWRRIDRLRWSPADPAIRQKLDRLMDKLGRTKAKPGRKADPEGDAKRAKDFDRGYSAGLWGSQAEYLRKRRLKRWRESPTAAKAWLTQLLKRAEKPRAD
jgi:hypothetical protein